MKSLKQTRSVRSIRSTRSVRSHKYEDPKAELASLDNLLLVACAKYNCPYSVTVKKETKQEDYYKTLKQSDARSKTKPVSVISPNRPAIELEDVVASDRTQSLTTSSSLPLNNIQIYMIYDSYNTLTELSMSSVKTIPRILMKIIGLLAPYYKNLVKLSINRCGIDMYTIYELSKILKDSAVTEICLDGSPVNGADYTLLLETTNLQNLSLSRYNIYDDTCKLIALKLHHAGTASNLLVLNLSTNHITDEGAKYVADALRTNRHLRYLNLSDNHITDDGAGYLFHVLMEFPLSYDEIINMRQSRMEYLKCRDALYNKYIAEYRSKSLEEFSEISRKSSAKKKKSSMTTLKSKSSSRKDRESANEDFIKSKAEIMTAKILGPFQYPFHSGTVKIVNEFPYCIGNMTLAYLNLAYNDLSHISVKRLHQIIPYQNTVRTPGKTGLVKVVLDGNNLPTECLEMTEINNLMTRNTWRYSSKISDVVRRKKQ